MFGTKPVSPTPPPPPRRRLLDNPRVFTVLALLLVGVMAGLFWLSGHTAEIEPQLVTDVVLYALLSVNLALLVALVFVLARNLVKLWVEQRQARAVREVPRQARRRAARDDHHAGGARAHQRQRDHAEQRRATGSASPVDAVVTGAMTIAQPVLQGAARLDGATRQTSGRPRTGDGRRRRATKSPSGRSIKDELTTMRDSLIELYRAAPGSAGTRDVALVMAVESSTLPSDRVRAVGRSARARRPWSPAGTRTRLKTWSPAAA